MRASTSDSGEVQVMIRPEQIEVIEESHAGPELTPAVVTAQDFHGHDALLTLRLSDGSVVTARIFGAGTPSGIDQRVALRVRDEVRVF